MNMNQPIMKQIQSQQQKRGNLPTNFLDRYRIDEFQNNIEFPARDKYEFPIAKGKTKTNRHVHGMYERE